MSQTLSTMLPLGTEAPDFSLLDTISGQTSSIHHLSGTKATVLMFICNHCPFVIHVNEQLVQMANEYHSKGVAFIGINSNSIKTHPQDGPNFMKAHAEENGYPFPYLFDESQEVAKAYDAACTPDFFLFDDQLKLIYRGQLDDSRPGSGIPVTGRDLRAALDASLTGLPVSDIQYPSMGCNIKWG